jgi:Protein of unknown function (DUF4013)
MNLRSALSTIHRDPHWWRTVLIGGALMATVVGYPWVAGLEIQSLENTRKGFATPLPRWHDWANRYVIGLLAVLIDIMFFVLPVVGFGLLFVCGAGILAISGIGATSWLVPAGLAALLLFPLAVFALGIAPVGRLIYAEAGNIEDALSARPLREACRPAARAIYRHARLQSLPAYLPALLLFAATWLAAWPLALLPLWLAFSALCYAHLVVVQLYVAADAEARWL